MRDVVVESFPAAPGLPRDKGAYLGFVDDIYKSDAYHSLSIEGYSVSPALIERVQQGNWDPEHHDEDRQNRDALAARGYWQAFQSVKETVAEIIAGANPGARARASHMDWYRELFQPCVAAGLIPAGRARGLPQRCRLSAHLALRAAAVGSRARRDAGTVRSAGERNGPRRPRRARALAVRLHPSVPDGNGRMARFVMNAMLASGGYPWTVIRVEDRDAYLSALDRASIDMDIAPFTTFIAERVRWSLEHSGPKA